MSDRKVFVEGDAFGDDTVWVGLETPHKTLVLPLSPDEAMEVLELLMKWKESRCE